MECVRITASLPVPSRRSPWHGANASCTQLSPRESAHSRGRGIGTCELQPEGGSLSGNRRSRRPGQRGATREARSDWSPGRTRPRPCGYRLAAPVATGPGPPGAWERPSSYPTRVLLALVSLANINAQALLLDLDAGFAHDAAGSHPGRAGLADECRQRLSDCHTKYSIS